MPRVIRRPTSVPNHPNHGATTPLGSKVRELQVGQGLPEVEDLEDELEGYMDVLLGRVDPPIEAGHLTLMEVADAYYARACEMQFLIMKAEREGAVFKGSTYYKFRTGQLRAFQELAKRAADLGSRRLTQARLLHDMAEDAEGVNFDAWD